MLPKMNGSAAPCEDFWNYACGGWLKDHALPPAARSKWSQVEEMAFRSESQCGMRKLFFNILIAFLGSLISAFELVMFGFYILKLYDTDSELRKDPQKLTWHGRG